MIVRDKTTSDKLAAERQQAFASWRERHGEELFYTEFVLTFMRIKGIDVRDEDGLQEALTLLSPFESLAGSLNVVDDDLTKLWQAMREARGGDPEAFHECVMEALEDLEAIDESSVEGDDGVEGLAREADIWDSTT
ncbi:hypothetical protein AVL62_00630 [Serinicoccus chungangensis]|uniref:Uncharacterized protein n=1 Tax=Serinicoccus chungangensis TaxID=767452 RepID=A0A0W8I531_9MICO|nr:hypothetical protein AVL62_00630 [Serinicoccus chungangensis]